MSEPSSKKRLTRESFKNLPGIFRYVWPQRMAFIGGLVLLFISSSVFMVFPYVSGKLVDIASGKGGWIINDIGTAAGLLIGVLFFQSMVSFTRVVLFARVTENAMAHIRTDLYERIIRLPMTFFDKNRSGELISRLSNDVSILQDALSVTLAEMIRQTVILLSGAVLIFFITPSLSVFMLATFPVIVVLALIFGRFIRKLSRQTQDQLAGANVIVEETLQSIAAVKAFTSEWFEARRYRTAVQSVVQTALRVAWYRAAFISFIIFMLFGGIVAVMWYGATLVQNGSMSVGDLLSFVLYTTFIGASIAGLGDLFGQLQKSLGAADRIMEILSEEPEVSAVAESQKCPATTISYQQVRFRYPTRPEVEVLKGIDLTIQAGEKIALVGQSGAGKSTIVQLLMRFYEPENGQIQSNGVNIATMDKHQWRSNIGIVPQEVILFGGSIAENIRYGKPDASDEEVREAARKANALDFIERFPQGFETLVGERGVKLSGGQRQRVAIARAVLKDPAILILDEATSSLDSESEFLVQQALNQLMEGRTTIVIAHRLATIREVDRIYVLENGQISEQGTHEELVSRQGAYRNYLALQTNLA